MRDVAPEIVLDDGEALAHHAAAWLSDLARASRGEFAVCLSGGLTPQRLYRLLATPEIAARFPWERVSWFWGDERFVPHDHPESNYRVAHEAFLGPIAVAPANIHAIPTEGVTPQQAADAYHGVLKRFHGAHRAQRPLFDVTLLGIGSDGHTASLFPGEAALAERHRWAAVAADPRSQPRITLTYPALDSSGDVAFLVSGAEKRDVLRRIRAGDRTLPAARIRPAGRLHWLVDRAAAGR
jgi:6-phosphogluconolactonase